MRVLTAPITDAQRVPDRAALARTTAAAFTRRAAADLISALNALRGHRDTASSAGVLALADLAGAADRLARQLDDASPLLAAGEAAQGLDVPAVARRGGGAG